MVTRWALTGFVQPPGHAARRRASTAGRDASCPTTAPAFPDHGVRLVPLLDLFGYLSSFFSKIHRAEA